MRRDLPLGVLAANLLHAGGESSPGNLGEGTFAVVLAVPDEHALCAVADHLRARGVACRVIVETEGDYAHQTMAIGVVPGRKEDLRRHLSSLPLLR